MEMLIDDASVPATKTELDLFSVPPTQVAVERGFWEEIHPVNTVTNNGPYEFAIDGNQYYLDMASNFVYLKIKIVMNDGSELTHAATDGAEANSVAPINLIGKTFFRQVKLLIKGKLAYDSGTDYPFISYMITDLNYDTNAKTTHLKSGGYEQDYTDAVDDPEKLHNYRNPGWEKRRQLFKNSRTAEFMAPLHIPLAHQEKYLLSNMDIRVELHRAPDRFVLMGMAPNPTTPIEQYKVVVQDIKFYLRKVELSRDLSLAVEQALKRNSVKYPIRRLEMKTLHIGQGQRTTPTNNLWTGQLPRRIVMCAIPSTDYFGAYGKNPFVFKHNNVIKAAIYVNGQCIPHSGPIETHFSDDAREPSLVMRAYTQLFNSMGIGIGDKSNGITLHRFKGDACYFAFDLSADNTSDSGNWELLRTGTVNAFLEFKDNIGTDSLRVLILGEFDNLITIDQNRQVFYDYAI